MGNDSGELGHNLMDHNYDAFIPANMKAIRIVIIWGEDQRVLIYLDLEILGRTNNLIFFGDMLMPVEGVDLFPACRTKVLWAKNLKKILPN